MTAPTVIHDRIHFEANTDRLRHKMTTHPRHFETNRISETTHPKHFETNTDRLRQKMTAHSRYFETNSDKLIATENDSIFKTFWDKYS